MKYYYDKLAFLFDKACTTIWHGRVCAFAVMSCMLIGSATDAQEDDAQAKAAKVKAVYLYNFIKFVEWPAGRSPTATHKAEICLMGESTFDNALENLKTSLTGQMELSLVKGVSLGGIGECNVLYITHAEDSSLATVLEAARKNNVLTVSELTDFADNDGIIEMKTVEKNIGLFSSNKINLRINLKAAQASGLKINAQLLEIAAEVIK